jgi:hypothetical protein
VTQVIGNKDTAGPGSGSDNREDDEIDFPTNNHDAVLRNLETVDYITAHVELCPTMFGIPETRGRLYYIGFKIQYWMAILGDGITRFECMNFLRAKLWKVTSTVMKLTRKFAMQPLTDFLVPETHQLYIKMASEAVEKASKTTKRRVDSNWVVMHAGIFEAAKLPFKQDIMDYDRYGHDNVFYNSLGARERSIIFYFDETSAPSVFDEVINT